MQKGPGAPVVVVALVTVDTVVVVAPGARGVVVVTAATDFVNGDADSGRPILPVDRIRLMLTVYVRASVKVMG